MPHKTPPHRGGEHLQKVTIVLPNLNGAGWLSGSLDSLLAQTEQGFRLIIVDNGSTDESLATARQYARRPNISLVEMGTNTGFSAAVNTGIKMADTPYVMLFNNDAFARADMLEKLLSAIEADEKAFGVQPLMLQHWKPNRVDDAGDFVTIFGWAFRRGDSFNAAGYQRQQRVFSACGGAVLYRRAVFDEIGLFEENFFAYLEDLDISWRANNLGWKCLYCPAAVCTHIGGATTGGEKGARYNDFKSIQSGRNSMLLPYKNMPILMLLLNLPFLLPGYLLKTLVFHLRGYGKAWNQGMREGLALLGRLQKPPFKLRNLPNYLYVQGSLLVGTFRFIGWRIGRFFIRD